MKVDWGNFESNLFFLKKMKVLSRDKYILEIGSGTGHLIKYLQNKGYNVTGTEADDKFIKHAKKNYGVTLIKETTAKLKFKDSSFDLVMSFDVLEHIPDVDEHVEEVMRVLKKNGIYVLCTPNKYTNIPFEVMVHKSLTKYKRWHCSLQNYWQLRRLFEKQGFDVEFVDVPLVNDFLLNKVRKHFGMIGLMMFKRIPIDSLPYFMRTNFYLVAKKR